jgi:AraC-like DNA-binding protein
MGTALGLAPELSDIAALFRDAAYGMAFYGDTKLAVAGRLKELSVLPAFDQLLQLISILQLLAGSAERTMLNHDLESRNFILKDKIRMGAVYEYIDAHYHSNPDVNVVARKVNLTTPAFCRYFKRQTNMTFTDFLNQYRIERAKNLLMQGDNVSETCYAVGLDSLSYFNKLFKSLTGENPSDFRKRHSY